MKLAIVINEFISTPTAHMLYIARLVNNLATTRPQHEIHLLYPNGRELPAKLAELGLLTPPANLKLHPLAALRKRKDKFGINLNAIFYHCAFNELKALRPDVVWSASFPKMWEFLLARRSQLPQTRWAYEVHGLAEIGVEPKPAAIALEHKIFKQTDILWSTTQALCDKLAVHEIKSAHLPFGCSMNPDNFNEKPSIEGVFKVGYFGSVYAGQGVDWLAEHWKASWGQLHIAGGDFKAEGVISYGRVPLSTVLEKILPQVDALIIPALNVGRMPYVYFTKAYDYLSMKRPILASNLPSIAEVLRPNKEALLFEPGNPQSLGEAIEALKGSAALRTDLTRAATTRARELSYDKCIEKFWTLVEGSK